MIREIIPEFEADLQSRLNRAADLWRLPYWDWASKKPVYDSEPQRFDYNVPELVRLETVKIRVPKKNSANGYKWVRNPLHSFRLPGDARMSAGGVQRVWKGRKYDRNDPNSYLYVSYAVFPFRIGAYFVPSSTKSRELVDILLQIGM